jgi:hypothetical protein
MSVSSTTPGAEGGRWRDGRSGARLATIAVLLLLAAAYSTWLTWSITHNQYNDFAVYYLSGQLYAHHGDPYGIDHAAWDRLAVRDGIRHYAYPYRYPPPTAGLVRLLLPLGPRGAEVVWGVGSALALIGGTLLLGRLLGGGWRTPAALLLLLLWYPAYHTLQGGQVNAFVYAALVVALWGLVRKRDLAVAAGLALGVALKITPLALVAYLLWQRRWRTVAAVAIVLAVLVVLLLPLTGAQTYVHYAGKALALTRPSDVSISPGIDSVRSLIGRLVLPRSETTSSPGGAAVAAVATGLVVLMAAISAAVLWRRKGRAASDPAVPLEFSLVVALSLIATPFTYYHQFVLLLIPLAVVLERLWRLRRWWLLGLVLLLAAAVDANQLVWVLARAFARDDVWRLLAFPSILAIVLWATCSWMLWRMKWRRVAAAEAGEGPGDAAVT